MTGSFSVPYSYLLPVGPKLGHFRDSKIFLFVSLFLNKQIFGWNYNSKMHFSGKKGEKKFSRFAKSSFCRGRFLFRATSLRPAPPFLKKSGKIVSARARQLCMHPVKKASTLIWLQLDIVSKKHVKMSHYFKRESGKYVCFYLVF